MKRQNTMSSSDFSRESPHNLFPELQSDRHSEISITLAQDADENSSTFEQNNQYNSQLQGNVQKKSNTLDKNTAKLIVNERQTMGEHRSLVATSSVSGRMSSVQYLLSESLLDSSLYSSHIQQDQKIISEEKQNDLINVVVGEERWSLTGSSDSNQSNSNNPIEVISKSSLASAAKDKNKFRPSESSSEKHSNNIVGRISTDFRVVSSFEKQVSSQKNHASQQMVTVTCFQTVPEEESKFERESKSFNNTSSLASEASYYAPKLKSNDQQITQSLKEVIFSERSKSYEKNQTEQLKEDEEIELKNRLNQSSSQFDIEDQNPENQNKTNRSFENTSELLNQITPDQDEKKKQTKFITCMSNSNKHNSSRINEPSPVISSLLFRNPEFQEQVSIKVVEEESDQSEKITWPVIRVEEEDFNISASIEEIVQMQSQKKLLPQIEELNQDQKPCESLESFLNGNSPTARFFSLAVTLPLPKLNFIDGQKSQNYFKRQSNFKSQLGDPEFLRQIAQNKIFQEQACNSEIRKQKKLPDQIFEENEMSQSQMPQPYVPAIINNEIEVVNTQFSKSLTRYEQIPLQLHLADSKHKHTSSFCTGLTETKTLPKQINGNVTNKAKQQALLGDINACFSEEGLSSAREYQNLKPIKPIAVRQLKEFRHGSDFGKVMSPNSASSILLSGCSSPSMMFSQTNQDRITLQSVIQAQEMLKSTNKKIQQTRSSQKTAQINMNQEGYGFYAQRHHLQIQRQISSSAANISDSFQDSSLQITQRTNYGLFNVLGQHLNSDVLLDKSEIMNMTGFKRIASENKRAGNISSKQSQTEVNFISEQIGNNLSSACNINGIEREHIKKNLLDAFKDEQFERQISNRSVAQTHRTLFKEQVKHNEHLDFPLQVEQLVKDQTDFYKSMGSQFIKSMKSKEKTSLFEENSFGQFSFKACADHFRTYNSNQPRKDNRKGSLKLQASQKKKVNNTLLQNKGRLINESQASSRQYVSFDLNKLSQPSEKIEINLQQEQIRLSKNFERHLAVSRSSQFKDLNQSFRHLNISQCNPNACLECLSGFCERHLMHDSLATHKDEDLFLEEFLTEDEVAVFMSQPNDICSDQFVINIKQHRHKEILDRGSVFEFSYEECDCSSSLSPIKIDRMDSDIVYCGMTGSRDSSSRFVNNHSKHTQSLQSQITHQMPSEVSLSTQMDQTADEEANDLTCNEDHLSPKFEKLKMLQSMPSHKEHSLSVQDSHMQSVCVPDDAVVIRKAKQLARINSTGKRGAKLRQNEISPTSDSVTTQKQGSFLSRVVKRQSAKKRGIPVTPSSQNPESQSEADYKDYGNPSIIRSSKPGIASISGGSPSTNGSRGLSPVLQSSSTIQIISNKGDLKLGCQTATNHSHTQKDLQPKMGGTQIFNKGNLMPDNPRDVYGFKDKLNSRQSKQIISNFQRSEEQILKRQAHLEEAPQIQKTFVKGQKVSITQMEQTEPNENLGNSGVSQMKLQLLESAIPEDLKDWLSQIGLAQYGPLLVDQGFDDLTSLVQMVDNDRILPLREETLKEVGIKVSGHRARILVHLELASGSFEKNPELVKFLVNFAKQKVDLEITNLQGISASLPINLSTQTSPNMGVGVSSFKFGVHTHQVEKPQKNTKKLTPLNRNEGLQSPQPTNSPQFFPVHPQQPLAIWLQKQNLLFLQPFFIRSGQDCLTSLFMQAYSQLQAFIAAHLSFRVPMTDKILKDEIGIVKIGHRLRLLSQLRQDALIYFYQQCINNFSLDFNEMVSLNESQPIELNQRQVQNQIQQPRNYMLPAVLGRKNLSHQANGWPQYQKYEEEHLPTSFEDQSDQVQTSSPICTTRPTHASLALQAHMVGQQVNQRANKSSDSDYRNQINQSAFMHSEFQNKQQQHSQYFKNVNKSSNHNLSVQLLRVESPNPRPFTEKRRNFVQRNKGEQSCITF